MRRLQVQISAEFFMWLLDVACTVLCFPIGYTSWPVAEWSKLSFSSPDLLAQRLLLVPWRNIWSSPGGRKWFTPLTGIGCVHHIEEKVCTARFATGGIREIPDWKINQVDTRRLQPHRRQCTVEGHSNVLSLWSYCSKYTTDARQRFKSISPPWAAPFIPP